MFIRVLNELQTFVNDVWCSCFLDIFEVWFTVTVKKGHQRPLDHLRSSHVSRAAVGGSSSITSPITGHGGARCALEFQEHLGELKQGDGVICSPSALGDSPLLQYKRTATHFDPEGSSTRAPTTLNLGWEAALDFQRATFNDELQLWPLNRKCNWKCEAGMRRREEKLWSLIIGCLQHTHTHYPECTPWERQTSLIHPLLIWIPKPNAEGRWLHVQQAVPLSPTWWKPRSSVVLLFVAVCGRLGSLISDQTAQDPPGRITGVTVHTKWNIDESPWCVSLHSDPRSDFVLLSLFQFWF